MFKHGAGRAIENGESEESGDSSMNQQIHCSWKKWVIAATLLILATACTEPQQDNQQAADMASETRPNLILIVKDDKNKSPG